MDNVKLKHILIGSFILGQLMCQGIAIESLEKEKSPFNFQNQQHVKSIEFKDSNIQSIQIVYARAHENQNLFDSYLLSSFLNLGEFLFSYATEKLFKSENANYLITTDAAHDKEKSIFLTIFSNILTSRDTSVECIKKNLYEKFLNSNCAKMILLGCGTQLEPTDDGKSVILSEDMVNILKKCHYKIGCRGEISQNVLKNNGLPSVILGCPSLLLMDYYKNIFQEKSFPEKIAVSVTPYSSAKDNEKNILLFGFKYSAPYIFQTEKSLIDGSLNDFDSILLKKDHELIFQYYSQNFFFPKTIDEWVSYMKNFDLMVTSRIHGAIAALLGGCRALCIVHDSRTKELCETLKIPFVESFDCTWSIEKIYKMADPKDMLDHYPSYKKNYYNFLEEAGIPFIRM